MLHIISDRIVLLCAALVNVNLKLILIWFTRYFVIFTLMKIIMLILPARIISITDIRARYRSQQLIAILVCDKNDRS
ncbi:hypothetical protein [Blochmannia endosymbiont of Camponotus (Colobopsis) obliquus]|uniref:hypothetical protein n=1 Tax=Blochmannia endosymbiont of Camponotus (Colobopsis) obliquus TaxID=1505597 RepID=UPI000A5FEFF0|nr:hypothetical protein [Blochmannia endosymbiont of Camponotus (Colobopsis) obliquus]